MLMAQAWEFKREHLQPAARSHYIIVDGGDQPNVVPQTATIWFYFRERDYELTKEQYDAAALMAQGAALMTGTQVDTIMTVGAAWGRHFSKPVAEATYDNIQRVGLPEWSDDDVRFAEAFQREMGVEVTGLATEIGDLQGPVDLSRSLGGGSDDIGDISWNMPTVTMRYPSNMRGGPGHNWANGIAMATPVAHKGGVAGAKVQALTLLDLFLDGETVAAAWDYFNDVQTAETTYIPFISEHDQPAIWLNEDIMATWRERMRRSTTTLRVTTATSSSSASSIRRSGAARCRRTISRSRPHGRAVPRMSRAPHRPRAAPWVLAAALGLWPGVGQGSMASLAAQDIDVVEMTVADVQAGYRNGDFTAVELTRAFLARIAQYEDHYNAFISMNPDALATAAALDVEYAGTGPRGPLHGVPVVIKDNIDYGGLVTTAGWEGFSSATGGVDMIPDDDAAVVTRLREAGAIILGKTNLPDFAGHGTRTNSTVAGQTLNPYNIDKVPGGSSGGTATAVNASFAVLGLGTETGGSIQNPSSAQALVGIKPTYGLVPARGGGAAERHLRGRRRTDGEDRLRRHARTRRAGRPDRRRPGDVRVGGTDARRGYVAELTATGLEGKRFGLVGVGWRTDWLPLDENTEREYRRAVEVLEGLGAEVVEDPFLGSGFVELYGERSGVPSQGTHDMFVYLQGLGPGAPFNTIEEWEMLSGREYTRGRGGRGRGGEAGSRPPPVPARPSATEEGDAYQAWRHAVRSLFREVLAEHELDGLFFPQSGTPNRNIVEDPERPDFAPNNWAEIPSNIINDLGVPTVTVPFSYYDDGTPFVVAWIGDTWTEAELLAYAHAFEEATRARVAPALSR